MAPRCCSVEIPAPASKRHSQQASSGTGPRIQTLGNSGTLQLLRARASPGPGSAPSRTNVAPPAHHFYIVRPDDLTSEDVGEHALGNRDAGPWLTRYNKKRGTDLRPGDRLLVPDEPPSQADILSAKREVYPQEAQIVWQRWLATCDTDECKNVRAMKAEIEREYASKGPDRDRSLARPEVPIASEGEFKAAFQQLAARNRDVLEALKMSAVGPHGPVLMPAPTPKEYRLTPQAREFLRGVFREFGIEYFPDDVPLRMKHLVKGRMASWNGHEVSISETDWKSDVVGDYAVQLAILGHELMHAIQHHLNPADHRYRAGLERDLVKGDDMYRLTHRLVERAEMDRNAPGFTPLDPNDPTLLLEQMAMMVYYRILKKFGPATLDAMRLGLRPARPTWVPD